MKPIKVKWFKRRAGSKTLNEIYQQTGMLFSFASSSKEGALQCHEWVKCRDFLHDAVRCSVPTDPMLCCNIYGFSFNSPYNPLVDLTKMRMLVTKEQNTDKSIVDFKRKMKYAVRLLNHYETLAGVGKTRMKPVCPDGGPKYTSYKSIFLLTGPVMWMSSPYLVSMYSFLIRLGDKELEFKDDVELKNKLKSLGNRYYSGKTGDNDSMYLISLWDKLSLIIKNRNKLFSRDKKISFLCDEKNNESTGISIQAFHDRSGIYSLGKTVTMDNVLNKKLKALISEDKLRDGKKETNTG